MTSFARVVGAIALALLTLGTGILIRADQTTAIDRGLTYVVTGTLLLLFCVIGYRQTEQGELPLKTPSRNAMYAIFNIGLLCMVVGEIVYRHVEFVRAGSGDWATVVGVPIYDSIYGYLIALVPFNYLVYLLLKRYTAQTRISATKRNLEAERRVGLGWLVAYGALALLTLVGFFAAFFPNDFMYVPSMMFACLFTGLLFIGVANPHQKLKTRRI